MTGTPAANRPDVDRAVLDRTPAPPLVPPRSCQATAIDLKPPFNEHSTLYSAREIDRPAAWIQGETNSERSRGF